MEESIPLQCPMCDHCQFIHDTHCLAPAHVLEIPGIVIDLVFRGQEMIDVTDGFSKHRADERLPRSSFVLSDEIQTQDWTSVALEEIAEMLSGREMGRIDFRDEDRWTGDHRITLLRPEEWDARPTLDLGSELSLLRISADPIMQNLFRLDIVRDMALVVETSFQVPSPGEEPRSPRQELFCLVTTESGRKMRESPPTKQTHTKKEHYGCN